MLYTYIYTYIYIYIYIIIINLFQLQFKFSFKQRYYNLQSAVNRSLRNRLNKLITIFFLINQSFQLEKKMKKNVNIFFHHISSGQKLIFKLEIALAELILQ